jgi:hypothetical protein
VDVLDLLAFRFLITAEHVRFGAIIVMDDSTDIVAWPISQSSTHESCGQYTLGGSLWMSGAASAHTERAGRAMPITWRALRMSSADAPYALLVSLLVAGRLYREVGDEFIAKGTADEARRRQRYHIGAR